MISIGTVYRGPELKGSDIWQSIMTVRKTLMEFRGVLGESPWVNAVFIVSGSLGTPGFEGLEYGKYSRKDKAVVVQIAVPEEVVKAGNHVTFLLKSLHEANAMAYEFLKQKGVAFSLTDAEGIVDKAADRLRGK
jgi:hypothetical protein